jgi:hypothetical protein
MKNDIFRISNNQILFTNGKVIEFDYPIWERFTLVIDFTIIILLDIPSGTLYNENVFGLSTTGNFLWQIDITGQPLREKFCQFVGSFINESGQLVLFNWCDKAFIVNQITGKILDHYTTK